MRITDRPAKALLWVASSKRDYKAFPPAVQERYGFELYLAQLGSYPPSAKPMKGFGGGIFELADEFDGNAYRAIYAVRFEKAVYVLHAFKKKSKRGIKTPKTDIDLIQRRLKDAGADYETRFPPERKP
ncbi:MAG: hypothetical protein EXR11_12640 [Rhodospirillaceae bacterium]|nr:hypothetical protein [Rhodospirillaceae bacterium]